MKKFIAMALVLVMLVSALPLSFASMVTGISFESIRTQYLYESDGEWRTDAGGNDYYHYEIMFFVGDKFTMYMDGDRADHFTCFYDEAQDRMVFVNDEDESDVLAEDQFDIPDAQAENHWTLGENSYEVDWGGKRATVTVQVVENPVKAIRYEPAGDQTYYFECDGHWETDEDYMPYFRYELDMMREGDRLIVTDNDDNETEYVCHRDDERRETWFENESGARIEEGWLGVHCFEDQNAEHFSMDKENYYHVYYSGRYCDVQVNLVPNPITSISYQPIHEKVCFFETDGRIEIGEYGQEYFCYDFPRYEEGDILSVTDSDDNTVTYSARWNEQERHMFFESEDGEVISEEDLECYDNQPSEPFTVGTNYYYVKYFGRQCAVPVEIIESPIAAIAYQPRVEKVLYFECEGRIEQGDNGQDYYRYDFGHMDDGDVLTVTDKDGLDTVYTARRDDNTGRMVFESENGAVIDQDELNFYDEQHRVPFSKGTNYYYVTYCGKTAAIPVQVIDNPVSAIRYEPQNSKTFYFESGGRMEQGDNGEGYYHYDFPFCEPGDRLIVTDTQGDETVYTARRDDREDRMFFESEGGDVIDEREVNFYDEQHRTPYVPGGENNFYYVRYSGITCTVPVTIEENPIASIAYTSAQPIVVYENTDGQWETDRDGEPYFNYFGATRVFDGDILTVTDKEGNSKDYISRWNEQERHREFVAGDGEVIDEQDVCYFSEQYEQHFTLGDNNFFYVEYCGQRAAVPVSVLKNPISAVEFIPVTPAQMYEYSGGEWRQNEQGQEYYNYWSPNFCEGDVLNITYSESGETVAYTYRSISGDEWDRHFYDADDNMLDTDDKLYTSRLGDWSLGDDNYYAVYYYEVESAPIRVSIIENPVASIEYIPASDVICYFESGGEWDNNGTPYYRYYFEVIREGDILRVTDKDNQTAEYTAKRDAQSGNFYFEDTVGNVITREEVQTYDRQQDEPFTFGEDNHYFVEFRGKVAFVPVQVTESPLNELIYTPTKAIVCYFETEGEWETDQNGEPYFRYWFSNLRQGDTLTLVYKDDTTITYTAVWDSAENRMYFESKDVGERISQDDIRFEDNQHNEHFTTGVNYYTVSYLGKSCTVPVSVVQKPVKAVEYIPVERAQIIENTEGYWRELEDGTTIWWYNTPSFMPGDILKITAPDDTVTAYTYQEDPVNTWDQDFFDSLGNRLPNSDELYTERDWDKAWVKGADDNVYTLRYYGIDSNPISVDIIDNPVKEITYTSAVPIVYFLNTNGYWDDYYNMHIYYMPARHKGDILTVIDREDNVSEYVLTNDGNDWYYENAGGERIDENEIYFHSDQQSTPWVLGDNNAITVEYHHVTTTIFAAVTENPVADFAFIPTKEVAIDECTGGQFEYDFFIYDIPIYDGDKFVVTYKSGEVVEYTFSEADMQLVSEDGKVIDAYDIYVESSQFMRPWTPEGENSFYIEYGGIVKTVAVKINQRFNDKSVVEPTCTAFGYTLRTNTETGESYKSDYVASYGHDFTVQTMSEHTLRTQGENGEQSTYYYTCSRCGALSMQEDYFFTANAGIVKGKLELPQSFDKSVEVKLLKNGAVVQSVTIWSWEDGSFMFYNVEQGEYSLLVCGDAVAEVAVADLGVSAGESVDLNDSSDSQLQHLSFAFGDFNGDGVVDLADITELLQTGVYGSRQGGLYDLDDNGIVNVRDLAILLDEENYGATAKSLVYA